jgi:Acyl-CoA dehydrogenase, C-terminal domain
VFMDPGELGLLEETFRKTMSGASGQVLDVALAELGWRDMVLELPGVAVPLVFRLLGETGAQAPLLNDVLLCASGRAPGGTVPLPYAGGSWVVWERCDRQGVLGDGAASDGAASDVLDGELPLRTVPAEDVEDQLALGAGRRAVGWWLAGTGRAMLSLARAHVLDRVQFGRPLAAFQAVRHRLAETFVALEGAEAALTGADEVAVSGRGAGAASRADGELAAVLAKAAAGQAALTAARHCQQVLGGIGFTAEHGLHRHVRRALVLDGLLGSTRELTREAGTLLVKERSAPRLVEL